MNSETKSLPFASPPTIGRGERGGLTLFALALSIALLTLTLAHYRAVIKGVRGVEEKMESYLCLRHFVEKSKKQLATQRRFNLAIRALNAAMVGALANPPLLATLKTKKKVAIKLSGLSYMGHFKDLLSIKRCRGISRGAMALNSPFRAKGPVLIRSADGQIVFKKPWRFFLRGRRTAFRGLMKAKKGGGGVFVIRETDGALF
ncbi:MAG: hypothetical protein OXB88_07605 [Bacteriovoracales bacterium]|nr:hypothetical protein [Bacteriovoracales bacterium]